MDNASSSRSAGLRHASKLLLVVWWVLASVSPARAQDEGTKAPVLHKQVVSGSPILWTFKWFNAEYERKISATATWGVSGSFLPLGDFDYRRATAHLRYYPQGAALTGFYVGGQAGIHRVSGLRRSDVVFGAGADIGYAWLFGAKRNVALSLGIGATRLFGGALDGASVAIPNVRLFNVGIAF